MGEQPVVVAPASTGPVVVDTFAGRVHVEWDNSTPVTAYGQMPFFVDFVICRARHTVERFWPGGAAAAERLRASFDPRRWAKNVLN
jgi:hypothetical protein